MVSFKTPTLSHVVTRGVLGLVVQMLKGHRIRIRRFHGEASLTLYVSLSVIVLHRFFQIVRFGHFLIDCLHSAIRRLIGSLGANRLAGRFHNALRGLVRRDRLFLESFTSAHNIAPKVFDGPKLIIRTSLSKTLE